MANQFATNFPIPTASNSFEVLWKLTRVMKAAGWQYRSSGGQSVKDASGIAANDLWGNNANPLLDTYATNNITGAYSGATGNLPQATINYAAGNGTFSAGAGSMSILSSAGWQTINYTSVTVGTSFNGCTGGTGTILTGGSGVGSPIVAGGGNVGFDTEIAWWCASGPLTVKVPLASLPTGTPLRSEIVTQATSGATGELFGYVWDPVGLTGWAVIGPQHTPENTTITSGSSGSVLPQSTINVVSTTGFASSGIINVWSTQDTTAVQSPSGGATLPFSNTTVTATAVNTIFPNGPGYFWILTTGNGYQQIYYTGTTATTFTGCYGGTGTVTSNGTANSIIGPQSLQQVSYTGTSGGNSFTGCAGGTGVMMTGNNVTGYSTVFDNTHTITGGTSGATMTPTGTVTYFQREALFAKTATANNTSNIYYVAADGYLENNQLFSSYTGAIGCTPLVSPGQGGTGNTSFTNNSTVTGAPMQICVVGSGGAVSGASAITFGGVGTSYGVSSQIGCANAIPAASTTADGSFYAALPITTTAGLMTGLTYTRLDDQEPGDCDPYAWLTSQTSTNTISVTYSRTANATNNVITGLFQTTANGLFGTAGVCNWIGYQARGAGASLPAHDVTYGYISSLAWNFATTASPILTANSNNPIRLVGFPSTSAPIVREPMLLFTTGQFAGTFKQIKGRARWVTCFSIGNTLDTFDSKTWIAVSAWVQGVGGPPCIALGPYDGSTTPIP